MKILITVPHADCDTKGHNWPHPCDYAAEPSAFALSEAFGASDNWPDLLIGGVNRALLDLNRREAASSNFHRRISELITRNTLYIDMHSYPEIGFWAQQWGGNDFVLCAFEGVNEAYSEEICARLNKKGIACKVQKDRDLPLMKDYYLIQRFGPMAGQALMIEMNESQTPERQRYTMQILANVILGNS